MNLPLSVAKLSETDIENVIRTLKSGMLTMGEGVKSFEKKMAQYLNVNHFIMVNSGSSANLLIFEYLLRPSSGSGLLKPGDGVLVPAIAWPTTIWPIIQLGLVPVFVDVSLETLTLDLERAEQVINDSPIEIKAIFPIHVLGYAIDHALLSEFSKKHKLILINDVCESLGAWRNGIHAGCVGIASSYSFYFSHHITTMEGGGIATDSLEMANDLRAMRSHGWSRDRSDSKEWTEGLDAPTSKFQFITTGYNVRPTEIQAVIGLNQVSHIDEYVQARSNLAFAVSNLLKGSKIELVGNEHISLEQKPRHSWMMLPLKVNSTKNDKVRIQEFLEENGVETRPVLTGNFLRQPVMRHKFNFGKPEDFPNADWISEHCFLIGAHQDYADNQINYLMEVLKKAAEI